MGKTIKTSFRKLIFSKKQKKDFAKKIIYFLVILLTFGDLFLIMNFSKIPEVQAATLNLYPLTTNLTSPFPTTSDRLSTTAGSAADTSTYARTGTNTTNYYQFRPGATNNSGVSSLPTTLTQYGWIYDTQIEAGSTLAAGAWTLRTRWQCTHTAGRGYLNYRISKVTVSGGTATSVATLLGWTQYGTLLTPAAANTTYTANITTPSVATTTIATGEYIMVEYFMKPTVSTGASNGGWKIVVGESEANSGTKFTTTDISVPMGVSASVNKSSESWFGETQIYGTPTGGLNPANYQARAKITTPANGTDYPSTVVYKDMTWNAGNSRWEATYKLDSDGYGAGLADPRTGAFTIQVQLDAEAPYFQSDGDAEYTADTSFTSIIVRRRPSVNAAAPQNYTDFIPIWSVDHWNYSINEFAIEATAVNTNTIIKYPVYPTTSTISNVSVTGTTVGLADGYASYWDSASHSIVFKIDVINGQRLVNVTFDSDTDLFGTRIDRYQTKDIGVRDFYNGLEISNSKLTAPIFGGGHEGAGEAVDLHAKDATTESTLDCMERVALWINDTVNIDSAGYYNANVKWKQTGWQNWITAQDNGKIVVENEEDDTATTGWKQKLDYGIDAHRKITFFAGENYDKHEYDFTNNGGASRKFSFVWGREQWLEGPGGGTREINDKGIVPDNTTDYNQVYPFAGFGTDPNTSLTKPWFTTYDTGSNYFMGAIFQNDFRPDNVYFDTGIAYASYTNYMPIFNTGTYANYPIPRPGDLAQASAESHWFEKSWNPVGVSENKKFTFLRTGGYNTSRANIDNFFDAQCEPISITPATASGSGAANTTVTYTNNIANNATHSDTINLSASSAQGWTVQIWNSAETSQISSVNLNGGANADVKIKVIIPPGMPDSTVDNTTLLAESVYNSLTDSAVDTTTVINTSASLDVVEVYSIDNSLDNTSPFDMLFSDVVPGTDYIIGESPDPQTYAIKLNATVSNTNYRIQAKAQSNFTSGANTIPPERLSWKPYDSGSWTPYSLVDQTVYESGSPQNGTYSHQYDYKLMLDWSDTVADNFLGVIIYTLTTF